jgi:hypothetical protein
MAAHATARARVTDVIDAMYGNTTTRRVTKDEREAILKGVESALRDFERSFPKRPGPVGPASRGAAEAWR